MRDQARRRSAPAGGHLGSSNTNVGVANAPPATRSLFGARADFAASTRRWPSAAFWCDQVTPSSNVGRTETPARRPTTTPRADLLRLQSLWLDATVRFKRR